MAGSALVAERADGVDVELDDGRRDVVLAQQPRDGAARRDRSRRRPRGARGSAVEPDCGVSRAAGDASSGRPLAAYHALERRDRAVEQRVDVIDTIAAAMSVFRTSSVTSPSCAPSGGDDERELADLRQGDRDAQCDPRRIAPQRARCASAASGLPTSTTAERRQRSASARSSRTPGRAACRPRRRTAPRTRRASAAPRTRRGR